MNKPLSDLSKTQQAGMLDPNTILNSLTTIILILDPELKIIYSNQAAEEFFESSSDYLEKLELSTLLTNDSPIFNVIDQAIKFQRTVYEYNLLVESRKVGKNYVNIQVSPYSENPKHTLLSLQTRSISNKIERLLFINSAARSVNGIASILAHEIKNPISGIKGAAQLLEQTATSTDRVLTRLLQDESDRICELIDRMSVFSNDQLVHHSAVNIHEVLNRVEQISKAGFGASVQFSNLFDPSLPLVFGDRDQLVQVFLNLVKNASEKVPKGNGHILLKTSYQHGVRFGSKATKDRVQLPLCISIIDNGPGIDEAIKLQLFEPFVTSKHNGSGLGLAIVAKIVDDHGGTVEFERLEGQTIFKVMLPVYNLKEGSYDG